MKKVFLLLCASQLCFAQNLLFNQQPSTSFNFDAISSNIFNKNKGIFTADDFELDRSSKITKAKIYATVEDGFLDQQNLIFWNLQFYMDNDGKPSAIPGKISNGTIYVFRYFPVQGLTVVTPDINDPTKITIEFDLSDNSYVFEENKKYWVSAFATVNENTNNFFDQKNLYWRASTSNLPKLEEAKMVDPDNIMHDEHTTWKNASTIATGVTGMAFQLYGTETLSTNDIFSSKRISIYPNPATKEVNIKGNDIKNTYLYSTEGKLILSSSESTINVEKLVTGIYFIKIVLNDGTQITDRFIKN